MFTDDNGDKLTVDRGGMIVRASQQDGDVTYLVEWYDESLVEHTVGYLAEIGAGVYEVRATTNEYSRGERIGDAGSLTAALDMLAQHHNA